MKKFIKFGLAGIAALALSSTLSNSVAQGRLVFDGTYGVTGKNPDGTPYNGTMTIVPYGDGYRLTQNFDNDTYKGIGNDVADYLAGSYIISSQPVVTIYRVTAANVMTGFWQNFENTAEGSEEATLTGSRTFASVSTTRTPAAWNYAGTYGIRGTNPDNSTYTGTMVLSNHGDGYHASLSSGGSVWRGVANYIGNYLAISWQAGSKPQVSIFSGNPRSGDLKGFWQDYDSLKEGSEIATLR